jgi:hypothetical protein
MTIIVENPSTWRGWDAQNYKPVRLTTNMPPEDVIRINYGKRETRAWIKAAERSASEILCLATGWNGPGSRPINRKSLAKLLRVLLELGADDAPVPQLVPLSSGGIQAEWHFLKQSIEVGVTAAGEILALATDQEGNYAVEPTEAWFILGSDFISLRRAILSYAERVHRLAAVSE